MTSIELPPPGIFTEMLSILFPVRCVHCGRGGNWICPSCAAAMEPIGPDFCARCGRPARTAVLQCGECRGRDLDFTGARAAFHFSGPARSLVHSLKFSGQRRLASFMAGISAAGLADLTDNLEVDNLIPVPLHKSRRVSRGYNQAAMYARALARELGLRSVDILAKTHITPPQNRLDYGSRRKNLINSFSIRPGFEIKGSRVILVDDVYTTGSTAAECARVLKDGLGVDVFIWTFARAVRQGSRPAENRNTKDSQKTRWEGKR